MANRIKSFSRKFLPSIITGLTILAIVTVASFSLLHPQSVNAQQVSRGNGSVSIQLPSTGNQNDNWSCGPNSAARVLAFYGRNVDYNTVRSAVNQEFMLPPSIKVPAPKLTDPFRTRRIDIRTGTTPHVLRDVMKRWEGENVKLERKADFATLQRVLNEGKPVVALVRVGSIDTVVSGTWPEMHWISVTGFNEQKREIYYTDTDGGKYYYTYDEFLGKWDWRVGTGFASEALYKNGVQSRTMIWVDRTPSSLASSSITPVGKLVKLRNKNWGRCLNLQNATQNGVAANAWDCVSHPDQEWKIEDAGNGFVKLRNKNWGRCLNLQNATKNGVTANAWECVSHPDQEWKIESAG